MITLYGREKGEREMTIHTTLEAARIIGQPLPGNCLAISGKQHGIRSPDTMMLFGIISHQKPVRHGKQRIRQPANPTPAQVRPLGMEV